MAIKFSQFNLRTDSTSTMYLVGYDGNQNIHITVDNLLNDFINGTENTIAMFGPGGNNVIDSMLSQNAGATLLTVGGQLNVDAAATFDTSITVTGDSTLNGNVTLGNASTDLITQTGTLYLQGIVQDTTQTSGTEDQILVSDAGGLLNFQDLSATHVESAEVVKVPVKNLQGSELTKGDPVYISGSVGESGKLQVKLADASNPAKMPAVGLLFQDLGINGEGYVVITGKLRNLTTDPIDGQTPLANDVIYVKPNGVTGDALTLTKPIGSNLIQNMGKVGRDHGSTGNLIVSSIMRSNDVPNLADGTFWLGNSGATPTSFSSELQTKLASGTFSAELTALRGRVYPSGGSGTQVDIISWSAQTTANPDLVIGQRDSGFIADIHVHPGTTGKTFLHYGDQVAAGNFETQRLHTTAEGIHVGDNLGGTYTAGDQQNNQDTGFGFVVGQRIDNLGHNCVAFGQNHDLSSCSINVFAQGYEVVATNNVKQCFGMGSHITFVGASGSQFTEGCIAGGEYAK